MRIAVVGANGKSGRAFVLAALAVGHEVRAGVFHSSNLTPHDDLTVVTCDATDHDQVDTLVHGCDAVVSLIGHVKGSQPAMQTDSIRTICHVMKARGVKRLISLTGTGVRQPGDSPSFLDRILNAGIAVIDPRRIRDGIEHVEYLQTTDIDWTVIRVLKLTNGAAGNFHLTSGGPAKLFTSRAEVALAILNILEQDTMYRELPVISHGVN